MHRIPGLNLSTSWPRPRSIHAGLAAVLLLAVLCDAPVARAEVPVYGYEVIHSYPHDTEAYTEGLFYLGGYLYESTGVLGHSSIRKVRLETGEVVKKIEIPPDCFGEGIVNWKRQLVSLTWKNEVGFVFDLPTLKLRKRFSYSGEGWALTQDGKRLIMSDGTSDLRFFDPETLAPAGRLQVSYEGKPVRNLNELEWVRGRIYANVWHTDMVAMIDPGNGDITGLINLAGLLAPDEVPSSQEGVLNGIAYDAVHDRLFVTGKYWPKLFEIRVLPAGQVTRPRMTPDSRGQPRD